MNSTTLEDSLTCVDEVIGLIKDIDITKSSCITNFNSKIYNDLCMLICWLLSNMSL